MTPLLGNAMEQVLEWQEQTVLFGATPEKEFDSCIELNLHKMNAGECTLTILKLGQQFEGISRRWRLFKRTIGSGTDTGVDACLGSSHGTTSRVENNGQDPFRLSHVAAEDLYVAQGYERNVTIDFLQTVQESIESDNVVVDDKFPVATGILFTTDIEVHTYLHNFWTTSQATISSNNNNNNNNNQTQQQFQEQTAMARKEFVAALTEKVVSAIDTYDALPTTRVPTLEAYQRLPTRSLPPGTQSESDWHQYSSLRIWIDCSVLFISSPFLFGVWSIRHRTDRIVRASQPLFLVMICAGAIIFGSAINCPARD
ncbi:expressed unknown protein [Seminavis robusta]|uniref:Uncharacterized protein n=1 Tax=Seminavis robusta TaxID=568900 RepID=A0A9N8EJI4_9STRA|nr:expressed unknown protein [Seminavis robusta]|eukprot:Sro1283_g259050.1 n/a (313) ;mRNA; r:1966-3102